MIRRLLLVLLLGTVLPCSAEEPLNYYFVDFPPFHFQPRDEPKPSGLTVELLRLAATAAGEPLTLHKVPLNRFIQLTQAGRVDVALVSQEYRQAFAEPYICSDTDLTRIHPTVYVNSEKFPDIQDLQALTHHTVHTPKSIRYLMSRLLPDGTALDTSYAIHLVTRGFNAGRIGLLADFRERMALNLRDSPPSFPVHTLALAPIGIVMCMHGNIANALARQRRLEQTFLQAAHSPQGKALLERYQMALEFSAAPD